MKFVLMTLVTALASSFGYAETSIFPAPEPPEKSWELLEFSSVSLPSKPLEYPDFEPCRKELHAVARFPLNEYPRFEPFIASGFQDYSMNNGVYAVLYDSGKLARTIVKLTNLKSCDLVLWRADLGTHAASAEGACRFVIKEFPKNTKVNYPMIRGSARGVCLENFQKLRYHISSEINPDELPSITDPARLRMAFLYQIFLKNRLRNWGLMTQIAERATELRPRDISLRRDLINVLFAQSLLTRDPELKVSLNKKIDAQLVVLNSLPVVRPAVLRLQATIALARKHYLSAKELSEEELRLNPISDDAKYQLVWARYFLGEKQSLADLLKDRLLAYRGKLVMEAIQKRYDEPFSLPHILVGDASVTCKDLLRGAFIGGDVVTIFEEFD